MARNRQVISDGLPAATEDVVLAFLQQRLRRVGNPYAPAHVQLHNGAQWWTYTDAASLAQALVEDAEFRALKLGGWLNTPDGDAISRAVGRLVPRPYGSEYALLVDALQYAAQLQRDGEVDKARKVVGAIFLAGGLVAIIAMS